MSTSSSADPINDEPPISISEGDPPNQPSLKPLVMQIVVRRDLLDMEGWGVGPLMAQTAHAAVAVLHETRNRPETMAYIADLPGMRKVIMETPTLQTLQTLSNLLDASTDLSLNPASTSSIPYHLWIEQPEGEATCLAIAPHHGEKSVRKALDKSKCRLWR